MRSSIASNLEETHNYSISTPSEHTHRWVTWEPGLGTWNDDCDRSPRQGDPVRKEREWGLFLVVWLVGFWLTNKIKAFFFSVLFTLVKTRSLYPRSYHTTHTVRGFYQEQPRCG